MTDVDVVRAALESAARLHEEVAATAAAEIARAAGTIRRALADGRKVLTFGNGGSAADAQHVACELVGRFTRERSGLAAVALTVEPEVGLRARIAPDDAIGFV